MLFRSSYFFPQSALPSSKCTEEQVICSGTVEKCGNKRSNFAFSLYWSISSILQVINFPGSEVFCFWGRVNASLGRCRAKSFLKWALCRSGLLHIKAESELQVAHGTPQPKQFLMLLSGVEPTQEYDCQWKLPLSYSVSETEPV